MCSFLCGHGCPLIEVLILLGSLQPLPPCPSEPHVNPALCLRAASFSACSLLTGPRGSSGSQCRLLLSIKSRDKGAWGGAKPRCLSARTQPLVPICQPCSCMSPNTVCVPGHTAVKLRPVAMSMQLLCLNRHEWEYLACGGTENMCIPRRQRRPFAQSYPEVLPCGIS